MKDRKKPKGTKAKVQASKKRLRYIGMAVSVAVLILVIAISGFFIYSFLIPSPNQPDNQNQTDNPLTFQLKAAIVDHLSLTAPNQTFRETVTNLLETAGYTVDYYPGEEVNVEFYRDLPTHGHSLIVLRVHSAITLGSGSIPGCLGLFTSEIRSRDRYFWEQWYEQLVGGQFPNEETVYFAISPLFVVQCMNGRFQNATIIQMGCAGLTYTTMAEAFIEKGAKVYISWSGDVLASHTDQATTQLLKHLVTQEQTIKHAVTETVKEVGSDPEYKSVLAYYPIGVGDQTIEVSFGS